MVAVDEQRSHRGFQLIHQRISGISFWNHIFFYPTVFEMCHRYSVENLKKVLPVWFRLFLLLQTSLYSLLSFLSSIYCDQNEAKTLFWNDQRCLLKSFQRFFIHINLVQGVVSWIVNQPQFKYYKFPDTLFCFYRERSECRQGCLHVKYAEVQLCFLT